ncbi:signal-induced proliferation-associated protein 1 isoform X2 [Alligator mississippiensis]|uniref:signal-induced proliferation-associated protein 1 isoform X2 n=1 Tax=Alligator mississippiensis TaxID=8496 RepID=UPI002877DD2B|nr:signal-induced proliferation-associated protein 1 isoform X2 [Alligator mississippiensis]
MCRACCLTRRSSRARARGTRALGHRLPAPHRSLGRRGRGPGGPGGGESDTPLVLSCPRFRREMGAPGELGEVPGLGVSPRGEPNAAVNVLEGSAPPRGARPPHAIEHVDLGATYYRHYFYGREHQNFVGEDGRLGPVAVSLRREEKELPGGGPPLTLHRLIIRTSQLRALRASVLEEALPGAGGPRALSPRRLLELVAPVLDLGALRLASPSPRVPDTLLKLDEQGLSLQRKVGVLYCRAGQGSEEQMYGNEEAAPPFREFLALLGKVVALRGFTKYRAQLDTQTDSTGTHSLYTTYQDYEIMFHVSTMLPYTPNNPQQLLRKRHIGNDIVTIVFQEPGALPFTPRAVRSHFQHVFIVVRVHKPCTPHTSYSVAVTHSEDIPPFGPPLPPSGTRLPHTPALRAFLLAKAINAENAAERAGRFHALAARTRAQYLQDLARAHATTAGLEAAASARRGPRLMPRRRGAEAGGHPDALLGALTWRVRAGDPEAGGPERPCRLGVSAERLVLVGTEGVLFHCSCHDVLAWAFTGEATLDLYYGPGRYLRLHLPPARPQDARAIVRRLQAVSRGCEARELALLRGPLGALGFETDAEGVVTAVERFTFAAQVGLAPGTRLLRLCQRGLAGLSPPQRRRLLRNAPKVCVTVLPPDDNGRPRRSYSELCVLAQQEKRHSQPLPPVPPDEARPGPGGRGSGGAALQLLRVLSLQEGPPHRLAEERTEFPRSCSAPLGAPTPPSSDEEGPVLPDPTPDLLLGTDPPGDPATTPPRDGSFTPPPAPPVLSEAGEEEEWEAVTTVCSSILETLAREGQHVPELWEPPASGNQRVPEEEAQALSEKVLYLESQEQAAKAALQAEIQTLRQIRPELGDAPPRVPQAPS